MLANRAIKVAVLFSLCLSVISGMLFLCGFAANPWEHYLSFNKSFHVGVWNREFDSRIVFFNDAEYGPYRGSLIGLEGSDPSLDPQIRAFGDTWGIYYRDLRWPDERLWTLMVSLWYPIILFALPPIMWWLTCRSARSSAP
ncbi:MAG: hypothetical protein JWM11_7978 [Planctomycetaceae bacterium]|nr:hypothetical protein [Planctomycetaceae bacterium]